MNIKENTYELIDNLKDVCHRKGMGNDGNEYKVITQVFLYKFLNDKFGYEIKQKSEKLANAEDWEEAYSSMPENERKRLLISLDPNVPKLKPNHLISYLWNQQQREDFDIIFDKTMVEIANDNIDIFSTNTVENKKLPLFEPLTNYVTNESQRTDFARALIDKLNNFSFEEAFSESYDFFAAIFEYMIKDYNTNGGGVYAEYYTPHAIAVIMARLLVGDNPDLHSVECYDPAAGTGTLLMALGHQIGEDRCTIFAQDISQKSNKMLKLNLILNGLVSSLDNAVLGDTLKNPYHMSKDGKSLKKFDYVVCNPPFNLNFEDIREELASQSVRFWAGVPKVPKKDKDSMAIYTCFIQHVINSLKTDGKGAIVLPIGFLTAKGGIERKIRRYIVDKHIVSGVVRMPPNVFAKTGTNVAVVFFDSSRETDKVILIDASKLGEEYREENYKKIRLTEKEIDLIIDTFRNKKNIDDFSVAVTYDQIANKNDSLSAGQHFKVKIEHIDITEEEFNAKVSSLLSGLDEKFKQSHELENQIVKLVGRLKL